MKNHRNSGMLNDECLCEYSNISQINDKAVTGFKLVREMNLNYYSIGTGMFRYKTGPIDKIHAQYHKLYENTPYYREEMVGKTAIFKSIEDLTQFYPTWVKGEAEIVIMKITLGGDLLEMDAKSSSYQCKVWAGSEIIKMTRYEKI